MGDRPQSCVMKCSSETKKKITIDCKEMMRKRNPDLRRVRLSQNVILSWIADEYLREDI